MRPRRSAGRARRRGRRRRLKRSCIPSRGRLLHARARRAHDRQRLLVGHVAGCAATGRRPPRSSPRPSTGCRSRRRSAGRSARRRSAASGRPRAGGAGSPASSSSGARMSGPSAGEPLVEARPRRGHQLEHRAVDLPHLALVAADAPARCRRGRRLAGVAHAPLAAHAQVRVDHQAALEAQEQVLAVGVDRGHRAAGQPLGPAVAPEARVRRRRARPARGPPAPAGSGSRRGGSCRPRASVNESTIAASPGGGSRCASSAVAAVLVGRCSLAPGTAQAKAGPLRPASTTSSSSTRRTTRSTTSTASGRASTGSTARARPQVDQAGSAYSCLLQNDVNLPSPPLAPTCTDAAHGVREPRSRTRRSGSRTTSSPTDTTCPAPGVFAPNGVLKGIGAARRLHARPRPPLLPGALPAQRRPPEPLRHGLGRRRPDDGPLRHAQAADLRVPAQRAPPALRDRRPLLPGARSAARSSTTSGSSPPPRRSSTTRPRPAPTTSTRSSTPTRMPTSYPLYTATGPVKDGALTQACPAAGRRRLRRLRRQHDPAHLPAVLAGTPTRAGCRRRRARRSATG